MAESADDHAKAKPKEPAKLQQWVGILTPVFMGAGLVLLAAHYQWAWRWLASGAPILTLLAMLGSPEVYHVLKYMPL
jgi:hypothetical protein